MGTGRLRSKLITGAALAAALTVAGAGAATATSSVTLNRIAGTTRWGTSKAIAQTAFSSARQALVASGADANFPDALTANYLAGHGPSPVVLTDPNTLSSEALSALQALSVAGVTVVGGTNAVSPNVVAQLQAAGFTVTRVAGSDRFATAERIAESTGASVVGTLGSSGKTALLSTGYNFPDALAGAVAAYAGSFPMLLTDPNSLSTAASNGMDNLGIRNVVILGGVGAVSANVEAQVKAKGLTTQRIAGADSQGTATAIADFETANLGFKADRVELARGDYFPDALSGGPLGGVQLAPILLTASPNALSTETHDWLVAHTSTITTLNVLGGTSAVSDATAAAAQQAAQGT